MPHAFDVRKRYVSFLIPRVLFYKLTQQAVDNGTTRNTLALEIFEKNVGSVKLRDEYLVQIDKEIEEAKKSRKRGYID